MRYQAPKPAGRLMAYCEACRNDSSPTAGLVVPIEMFHLDPTRLLDLMYRGQATLTDPNMIADMFGVPPGRWTRSARRAIQVASGEAGLHEVQVGDWKGVLPRDRDPVVRRHRRAQGEWRSNTLGWPAGPPSESETSQRYPTLPNYLAHTHEGVDVHDFGGNLMSAAGRSYAGPRVHQVKALGGVVHQDRLYRNLLSSQPLAFSIAGELRAHPKAAAATFAQLTRHPIAELAELEALDALVPKVRRRPQSRRYGYQPLEAFALAGVEAEWFPPRWAHTNDRSGFDVAACVAADDGSRLLISIEVKYVDTFSPKRLDWRRYRDFLLPLGIDEAKAEMLVDAGCSQVLRQVMITESVRRHGLVPGAPDSGRVHDAISVVLARDADEAAEDVIRTLARELDTSVQFWSLSSFLDATSRQPPLDAWSSAMRSRYLREP